MSQVIKVSKAGYNVLTDTDINNYIFDSSKNTFKILAEGKLLSQSVTADPTTFTVAHGQSQAPAIYALAKFPDGKVALPAETDYSFSTGFRRWLASVDGTNIKFMFYRGGAGSSVSSNTGYKRASTADNFAAVGTVAWSNPTDALTSNNAYASSSITSGQRTNWLRIYNFNFQIPSAATIVGVEVQVEMNHNLGSFSMEYVRLVFGGSPTGNNKSFSLGDAGGADQTTIVGGSSDMWGISLTPGGVNVSTFGVVLSNEGSIDQTANIDAVSMKVHYTLPLSDYSVDIKYYIFETPAT